MSRAMTLPTERFDFRVLDEDVWDNPGRLTGADIFAHAGPGWRRGDVALDDPEDER
jgi:hypothetical protein